jgi:hypothetical protein
MRTEPQLVRSVDLVRRSAACSQTLQLNDGVCDKAERHAVETDGDLTISNASRWNFAN